MGGCLKLANHESCNDWFSLPRHLGLAVERKNPFSLPRSRSAPQSGNLKREVSWNPPPPSALMARFTSGHMTKSSMPSMARVGSSYGNLKRDNLGGTTCPPQPSALNGTVYVGSGDKKLYAINGKAGVKLWEFETGGIVESSPAIGSDGTVYVGSGWPDKKLYAINGKTGVKLWEFEAGRFVDCSPAIGSDGTVYVGSWDPLCHQWQGWGQAMGI